MIVAPDTSPRGTDIPDDPDYALGQGQDSMLMLPGALGDTLQNV